MERNSVVGPAFWNFDLIEDRWIESLECESVHNLLPFAFSFRFYIYIYIFLCTVVSCLWRAHGVFELSNFKSDM